MNEYGSGTCIDSLKMELPRHFFFFFHKKILKTKIAWYKSGTIEKHETEKQIPSE